MCQTLVLGVVSWVEVDSEVVLGLAEWVAELPPAEMVSTKGPHPGFAQWCWLATAPGVLVPVLE